MRLELRHLRIVCAIADHGSVSKAASALGLAQPALTAQLQRIERTLGGALFDRGRRGTRPTALGELVLARARVVLPAVQGLEDEAVRFARTGPARRAYRIGAVPGPILGGPILSGLVRRLAAAYPDADLATRTLPLPAEAADLLAAGRLDFALVGMCGNAPPATRTPEVAWRLLATDPVHVLLPGTHPLAGRAELDLAKLADTPWALAPGDGCLRDCLAAACAQAGFTPRAGYESDPQTCLELVADGAAVALCHADFRPPPGLVPVPIAGTPLRWRHLLGWPAHTSPDGLAEELVAHAVAAHRAAHQAAQAADPAARQPVRPAI